MQLIFPSDPSNLLIIISTFLSAFNTVISVFSNPRHPGKSSSKIVTLQIVSSPSSLSTDFSITLPSVKVAYPSIGSP